MYTCVTVFTVHLQGFFCYSSMVGDTKLVLCVQLFATLEFKSEIKPTNILDRGDNEVTCILKKASPPSPALTSWMLKVLLNEYCSIPVTTKSPLSLCCIASVHSPTSTYTDMTFSSRNILHFS